MHNNMHISSTLEYCTPSTIVALNHRVRYIIFVCKDLTTTALPTLEYEILNRHSGQDSSHLPLYHATVTIT